MALDCLNMCSEIAHFLQNCKLDPTRVEDDAVTVISMIFLDSMSTVAVKNLNLISAMAIGNNGTHLQVARRFFHRGTIAPSFFSLCPLSNFQLWNLPKTAATLIAVA